MSLIATSSGIQGFRQTIDGTIVNEFGREEVVYFREYNPDSELEAGPAVMEIIKKAVAIEWESGLYMEAFFKNDATPSLLLSTEQTIQEPDMDKLLGFWNKTFRGPKRAQKVGLLDKGIKAQILSHNMKEIAMVELRDQARNDICVGFRVPKILVGSMVDSTYANASEARKFLLEDVIIPRSKSYADTINADLVHVIDPEVTFEFVAGDIPILQEGLSDKWKRLREAVEVGAITVEYARSQMGWPATAAPKPEDVPQTPPEEPSSPIEGEGPGAVAARSWRKKAIRAVKDGKSANVLFDTSDIPAGLQYALRSRLEAARSLDEVNDAFRLPSEALTPHQTFNIDVHVPAAEPPRVTVESPTVNVAAPEVHVAAPTIEVNLPRVSRKTEETKVVRNKQTGNLDSTVTSARYDYEK